MAGRIAGITIEIGGDTTKLQTALKGVDKTLKTTQSNLKDINKLLKLDPKNTDLLRQKQKNLQEAIRGTKERLTELKAAQSQVKEGTAEWDALQREIIATEQELKSLETEYRNFGSVAAQQIKVVGEKMQQIGDKMQQVGKTLTTYVTLPIVGLATKGVKSFAEVDKTMQLVNQTMGNTAEQADALTKAMEEAAANSIYGMSDAATALLNFARAGLTAEQAADALAPAMNLAAGEGGNLDTVSAGLVATINGFGDSFENTSKYADIFASACNNSALDVDSLSSAMSTAAPIFKTAGYTVQDATLYMGVMANNGIEASEAANALKTGLAKLIEPSKEGAEWMNQLGISVTNADGSMKDSITIQKDLNAAFSSLSESEQIAAASAIFGKNQMSKWLALINTAPGDVDALNTSLERCAGTTEEMADAMMGGFGGSIEKLKSSLDVLMTSIGKLAAEYLTPVIEKIQGWIDKFNSLDEGTKKTIVKIAGIVAAIGPLLIIGGKLISGIGKILIFAPLIASALAGITLPMVLITAAIVALIAVGVLLYKNWDNIKAKAIELKDSFVQTMNTLKNNVITAWNNMRDSVYQAFENLKADVINGWETLKTDVSTKVEEIKQNLINKWEEAKAAVIAKVEALKSAVVNKLTALKNAVKNIANQIRNAFNFNFSMPHIKMPHLIITYEEVDSTVAKFLGINRIPHFSVEWYKKAMQNPILFNSPTVLPTASGLKGFGEAGAEIVMGLDKLRELVGAGQNVTVNVVLQGDAKGLFKVVRQENLTRTRAANWNPLGAAAS